ncbi:MAG: hypothetical protein AAFR34_04075 [Pseudomonadota bacterium]
MGVDHEAFSAEIIKEVGFYTQKILTTLNVGGIVVLLTFIASIENGNAVTFDVVWLERSIVGFTVGLVCVGVSLFVTYLEAQFVVAKRGTQEENLALFLLKMVGPPLASFLCFLLAISFALVGVQPA